MSFLLVDVTHLRRPDMVVNLSGYNGETLAEFIRSGYAVHVNSVTGRQRAADDKVKARKQLTQPIN